MRALLAALLLCAVSAYAASPVVSCTPSRTSGVAPLFVLLDCTATTDADLPDTGNNTNRAFRELEYRHNFGDPNAGLWGYGANTTLSKNQATGAITGHVFETTGAYTITTTVSDGTSTRRVTNVITVNDPEVIFTGAATVCIANVTATAGSGGCPSGATTPTGTVDLPATISANCNAATKRCLLKRGDSFTATSAVTISSAGAITLGAYGTGAKPIITASANINAILLNNAAINDLRLMDLDVRTQSTGLGVSVSVSATMTRVTMLRVTLGPNAQGSIVVGGTVTMTESVVQDSILGPNQDTGPGGVTLFGRFVSSAILGNSIGPSEGQHVIRFVKFQKSVFANNTAGDAPLNETVLTIRAVEHVTADDDSYYFIVSDNDLFTGDRTNALLAVEPVNATANDWFYDYIIERNWLRFGAFNRPPWKSGFTTTRFSSQMSGLAPHEACGCILPRRIPMSPIIYAGLMWQQVLRHVSWIKGSTPQRTPIRLIFNPQEPTRSSMARRPHRLGFVSEPGVTMRPAEPQGFRTAIRTFSDVMTRQQTSGWGLSFPGLVLGVGDIWPLVEHTR